MLSPHQHQPHWVVQRTHAVHALRCLFPTTRLRERNVAHTPLASQCLRVLYLSVADAAMNSVEYTRTAVSHRDGFVCGTSSVLWFCDFPPGLAAGTEVVIEGYANRDDRCMVPCHAAALYGPELAQATAALRGHYPPLPPGWVRVPVARQGARCRLRPYDLAAPTVIVAELNKPLAMQLQRITDGRGELFASDRQAVLALLGTNRPSATRLNPMLDAGAKRGLEAHTVTARPSASAKL